MAPGAVNGTGRGGEVGGKRTGPAAHLARRDPKDPMQRARRGREQARETECRPYFAAAIAAVSAAVPTLRATAEAPFTHSPLSTVESFSESQVPSDKALLSSG